MDIPRITPQSVEYMVTYPAIDGKESEKVLMVVLNTTEGRWLLYAPKVIQREMDLEISHGFQDIRGPHNVLLNLIPFSREMVINNSLYVLTDKETFFNFIALDNQPKPTVKKEEIEKLFGCKIDG
jgi:hypothetical protein